jgi:hypothetical protein
MRAIYIRSLLILIGVAALVLIEIARITATPSPGVISAVGAVGARR